MSKYDIALVLKYWQILYIRDDLRKQQTQPYLKNFNYVENNQENGSFSN